MAILFQVISSGKTYYIVVRHSSLGNYYDYNFSFTIRPRLKYADVNGDGKVNSTDASLLTRYISKHITSFPAGIYVE